MRCMILVSLFLGCAGDASSPLEAGADPVVACLAWADARGETCARCSLDKNAFQICREAALAEVGGSCEDVNAVRDAAALYDVCLPWLAARTCEELADPFFEPDPSCLDQFELER